MFHYFHKEHHAITTSNLFLGKNITQATAGPQAASAVHVIAQAVNIIWAVIGQR